jgi:hypothetical protein
MMPTPKTTKVNNMSTLGVPYKKNSTLSAR